MAREANITQEQVNAAADALRAAGTKPTVRAVRERLGTGSNAVVMRLLDVWKAAQVKVADVPVTLPGPLQRALVDYLTQAVAEQKQDLGAELAEQKQVNTDLAVENERQADELDGLQAELEAMRTERDSLLGRLVQLEAELRLVRGEAEQERGAAETVRTELAKAQLRLEAVPRLEQDLAQAHAALVVERNARAAAEQSAAVADARLEAERAAGGRIEAELASAKTREEKAAEQIRAGVDQVRELTGKLAAEQRAHIKTGRELKVATELQASRRARLTGISRKPLNEQPADGGDKPQK